MKLEELKIQSSTLQTRVKTAQMDLKTRGLAGLIVYANGSVLGNQSFAHPYLRYLCDFDGHNTPSLLIVRPDAEPILLTGNKANMRAHIAEKALWFSDVRHVPPPQFGEHVVRAFADVPTAQIAYIGHNETPA